ncbi:DinB family protein [Phycicoccus sp. M110.8]|uniref:DinB family protein n=1 Tax=Phycicoccus sp. M110.8 TaxID=3075433 RepID=UPI0028FD8DD0|nr:DinB family protein [Phycicoccus sp. M110.8]MDU0313798.1 DinB family protein [Phycicoccus sp. M110.8]
MDASPDASREPSPDAVPEVSGPVPPDTKDWTWTLEQPCPECGFEAAAVTAPQVAEQVLSLTAPWRSVLERPDVRDRPRPDVWSPLEYACHVRDVCRVFEGRVRQMLAEDGARFANWDQDEAALDGHYPEQDPAVVAEELVEAAVAACRAFEEVEGDAWQRTGLRSNGSHFTVLTLGQYMLHDLAHHLVDVGVVPSVADR